MRRIMDGHLDEISLLDLSVVQACCFILRSVPKEPGLCCIFPQFVSFSLILELHRLQKVLKNGCIVGKIWGLHMAMASAYFCRMPQCSLRTLDVRRCLSLERVHGLGLESVQKRAKSGRMAARDECRRSYYFAASQRLGRPSPAGTVRPPP